MLVLLTNLINIKLRLALAGRGTAANLAVHTSWLLLPYQQTHNFNLIVYQSCKVGLQALMGRLFTGRHDACC